LRLLLVSRCCSVAHGRKILPVCRWGIRISSPYSCFLLIYWRHNQIYFTVLTIPNNTIYIQETTTLHHGKHQPTEKKRRNLHRPTNMLIQPKTHRHRSPHGTSPKRKLHLRPNRSHRTKRPKLSTPLPLKTSKPKPRKQANQNPQKGRILPHLRHARNRNNQKTRARTSKRNNPKPASAHRQLRNRPRKNTRQTTQPKLKKNKPTRQQTHSQKK
jgi:hypothetical protein